MGSNKVTHSIEIVFALVVVGIFGVMLNRYYGPEVRSLIAPFQAERRVAAEYRRYEDLAAALRVPEKTGATDGAVPVLVYHGIVAGAPGDEEELTLDQFTEQMFALKENGYQTITLEEFRTFVSTGRPAPEKSFVLTFDDGRKDSYYPVDPILKALDFTAVMFVITNTFAEEKQDSPYYLSVEELKTMAASGRWELESHGRDDHSLITVAADGTKGRFMSNKQWLADEGRLETEAEYRDRIYQDLVNAKTDLNAVLGIDAIAYAFPAGDYGHRGSNFSGAEPIIQAVMKEVYPLSFFQANADAGIGYYRGNFVAAGHDQHLFRRIKVLGGFGTERLFDLLAAAREKELPYQETYTNPEEWITGWGKLELEPTAGMTLRNESSSNSAATFLDGAASWRDYRFDAAVKLVDGSRYNLLARVENGHTAVGCSFERGLVRLFTVENGRSNIVSLFRLPSLQPTNENAAGIAVEKNTVQCLLNGQMILQNTLRRGGHAVGAIGLSVYSADASRPAILKVGESAIIPLGR